MKKEPSEKLTAIISGAFMIYIAVFQLITVGFFALSKLLHPTADDIFTEHFSLDRYADAVIISLTAFAILLLISGASTVRFAIKNDGISTRGLLFQKIICIIFAVIIITFNIICFIMRILDFYCFNG